MALVLLYADDFTGYANDAAFRAAYPYDPPTDLSTSVTIGVTWGATNGPDGQPGLLWSSVPNVGVVDKIPLAPTCRAFEVSGRWKFNTHGQFLSVFWVPSGSRSSDFAGNIVGLSVSLTGQLTVVVKTTAAYANGGANTYTQTIAGIIPLGTAFDIRVEGQRSTLTEGSPGVFTPGTDGYIRVSVDGVQVFTFSGPIWLNRSDLGQVPYWNVVQIKPLGNFTNWAIYHDDDCAEDLTTDDSTPCCGTKVDPGDGDTTPGDVLGPNPTVTLPPWIQACAGGGTVPTAADLTDAENWAA